MARLLHLAAAIALVAVVFFACRRAPAPSAGAPVAPASVAAPDAPAAVQRSSTPDRAPAVADGAASEPAPDGPTAPTAPAPAVASTAPSTPPVPTPIVGSSPIPPTGKPVAAVELAWDLQPDPGQPGRYQGSVSAHNQGGAGQVRLRGEILGAATLLTPPVVDHAALERGATLVLPVAVQVQPAGGEASLLVTVEVVAASTRSRIIRIPLRAPAAPATPDGAAPTTRTGDAVVPTGEHVLIDDAGEAVHFMPAAGQP